MESSLGPDRLLFCIRNPPLGASLDKIGTQFYLDGARVDSAAIDIGYDRYTLPGSAAIAAKRIAAFRPLSHARR